jgi:hypothetical protein
LFLDSHARQFDIERVAKIGYRTRRAALAEQSRAYATTESNSTEKLTGPLLGHVGPSEFGSDVMLTRSPDGSVIVTRRGNATEQYPLSAILKMTEPVGVSGIHSLVGAMDVFIGADIVASLASKSLAVAGNRLTKHGRFELTRAVIYQVPPAAPAVGALNVKSLARQAG